MKVAFTSSSLMSWMRYASSVDPQAEALVSVTASSISFFLRCLISRF